MLTALKQPLVYSSQLSIANFITHEIEVNYFFLEIFHFKA